MGAVDAIEFEHAGAFEKLREPGRHGGGNV